MEEIAARLGGSKATLYGYFDSKEQLFVESVLNLVIGNRQPLLDFFENVDGLDVAEVLTRFGELILVDVTEAAGGADICSGIGLGFCSATGCDAGCDAGALEGVAGTGTGGVASCVVSASLMSGLLVRNSLRFF